MANDKRIKVQNDIISATIECISKNGIAGTTVRLIASNANVNTSAISYYFASRDKLIGQALKITLDNAFDLSDLNIDKKDSYKTVLKEVFLDWDSGAAAYPGICQAHFDEVLNNHIDSSVVSDRLNGFIKQVFNLLIEHGLEDSIENFSKLKIAFGSFISSLIMPVVASPNIAKSEYIDLLVDMV
jgi:AcrR family transcriptional regulator